MFGRLELEPRQRVIPKIAKFDPLIIRDSRRKPDQAPKRRQGHLQIDGVVKVMTCNQRVCASERGPLARLVWLFGTILASTRIRS